MDMRNKFLMQDIIDNFVVQFEAICEWRTKNDKDNKLKIEGWSAQEIKKLLQEQYTNLITDSKLKLPEVMTSADFFGYFALINAFKLETLLGNYAQALNLIQVICLNHTIVFSKAFSSQMSLFYYASFCYFMT